MELHKGKKRRRSGGYTPVNTLANREQARTALFDEGGISRSMSNKLVGTPQRYNGSRRSSKIINKINALRPDALIVTSSDRTDQVPDSSIGVRKEYAGMKAPTGALVEETLHDQLPDGEMEFELSKTQAKRSTGRSLIDSVGESESNLAKYVVEGSIKMIRAKERFNEVSKCLLNFQSDLNGPRVSFTCKHFEIKNAQIDFREDCENILFDDDGSCMGVILREPRFLSIGNRSISEDFEEDNTFTRVFLWINKGSLSSPKMRGIKKILGRARVKTSIVPSQEDVMSQLAKLRISDETFKHISPSVSPHEDSESRSSILTKRNFKSLEKSKRSSHLQYFAAHKIPIPSSPVNDIGHIGTKSFYFKSSENPDLKKHTLSYVQSSRKTRSQTPDLMQNKSKKVDEDDNFEKPEIFKPHLCYKFDDGTSYTITNQDFKCLYNHDWINDSILDFFTKYYVEMAIHDSIISREDVHIMSSFFYTKLISDPNNYYGNVKKWVNNCDLFRKKYVVVPININFHWFGCIISNLDVLLEFFEKHDRKSLGLDCKVENKPAAGGNHSPGCENVEKDKKDIVSILTSQAASSTVEEDDEDVCISTPIVKILTFDSLRQTHSREVDPIKEFLTAYARDKYSLSVDKTLFKMTTCAVPQQPNMSDCGVHVILNTMKFFRDPAGTVEVWRSTKSRNKTNTKIINDYFERDKRNSARRDLRNVLWQLQNQQVKIMKEKDEYPVEGDSTGCEEEDGDIEIIDRSEFQKHLHDGKKNSDIEDNSNAKDATKEAKSSPLEGGEPVEASAHQELPESTNHSETPLGANGLSQGSEKIAYRSCRSSLEDLSQRKFLESSPLRTSNEGSIKGTTGHDTSPYFPRSSLKLRGRTLQEESTRGDSSPTADDLDEMDYHQHDKSQAISSPSPVLSQVKSLEGEIPLLQQRRIISRSPSSDLEDQGRVVISDAEHDDDVNLIGYPERGTLTQVRENVEKELNEKISVQIEKQNAILSQYDANPLAQKRNSRRFHRVRDQRYQKSENSTSDSGSESNLIETIVSD